jgi:hypothetical protein
MLDITVTGGDVSCEKAQLHIFGTERVPLDREANAVQDVVAMRLNEDLNAVRYATCNEFPQSGLSAWMEVGLRVFDQQQGAGTCRQARDQDWETVG